mgnify:CR=1 FL=1
MHQEDAHIAHIEGDSNSNCGNRCLFAVLDGHGGHQTALSAASIAKEVLMGGMDAKKAAKIGADAVIIATLGGYYEIGTQWASQDNQASSYTRIVGTAIRYKQ